MALKNDSKTDWEITADYLHQSNNSTLSTPKSDEFKFTKKLAGVRKEAVIISQFNKPEAAWQSVKNRIPKANKLEHLLKYAAIIVVSLLIGSAFTQFFFSQNTVEQFSKVEVPYGQTSKLTLHDGTEVWLNSGTSLTYPNQFKGKREVFLEGEAFFKVTKNKRLPFFVETDKLQVKVLGTSFNLSAYEEDKSHSLILIEGKVNLNKHNGQFLTELSPGEMAIIEDRAIRIKEVETSYYSSWIDGKLVFSCAPLVDIAKKLERSYNVKIQFENKELEGIQFTGTFLKYKPIEQILQAIKIIVPIDYEIKISQDNKNEIRIFEKY